VRVSVSDQEKRSLSVPAIVFGGVVEVATLASLWVRVCCSCGNKWETCGPKSF